MPSAVPNWHRASIPPWRLANSRWRGSLNPSVGGQVQTFRSSKKDKRMFHHLWVFRPWSSMVKALLLSTWDTSVTQTGKNPNRCTSLIYILVKKKTFQERKWEHLSIVKYLMGRWIGLCIDILLCQKLCWEKKRRGGNIIKAQNVGKGV